MLIRSCMSWEQLGCKSRSLARFPNRDMCIKSSQLYTGENATFHGRSALGTFYLNVWGGRGEENSPVEKKTIRKTSKCLSESSHLCDSRHGEPPSNIYVNTHNSFYRRILGPPRMSASRWNPGSLSFHLHHPESVGPSWFGRYDPGSHFAVGPSSRALGRKQGRWHPNADFYASL